MSSGSWCSLPPLRVNPHGAPPESRTSTSRHPSRLLWSRSSGFSISQWLWSPSEYRGSLLLSKVSMELRKTPHLIKDKRSVFNNRKKKGFLDNWRKKKTFYYTTMLPSPDHTPDCNTRCPPDISAFYFARCLAHIFILDAPASLFQLVGVCVCVLPFVPRYCKTKQEWKRLNNSNLVLHPQRRVSHCSIYNELLPPERKQFDESGGHEA